MNALQKASEIVEEQEELNPFGINEEAQKERIRRIIQYQKYLHQSSLSSLSSSGASSSSQKSKNLHELVKNGGTSLRRLFDIEHTSLATELQSWSDINTPLAACDLETEANSASPGENIVGSEKELGFSNRSAVVKKQRFPSRLRSSRALPRIHIQRLGGFRLRWKLRRLRFMVCARKF